MRGFILMIFMAPSLASAQPKLHISEEQVFGVLERPDQATVEAPKEAVLGTGRLEPSQGRITLGKLVVKGSLDKQIIRRVIRQHRPMYLSCYEAARAQAPHLEGRIVVKLVINLQGLVLNAAIKESTTRHAGVERCLVREVRRWRFPMAGCGGMLIVEAPFTFTPPAPPAPVPLEVTRLLGDGPTSAPLDGLEAGREIHASAARVVAGAPIIRGALDAAEVERVIHRRQAALQGCYTARLGALLGAPGALRAQIVIDGGGRVVNVEIKEDALKQEAVVECLLKEIKGWRFKNDYGGVVIVNQPFSFEPAPTPLRSRDLFNIED